MPSLRLSNFGDLKIANKLAIFVAVLGLPIAVLLFAQYRAGQDDINFAEAETDGMSYVSAVIPFMTEVQNHRALAQEVLNGDATAKDALEKSASNGDAALAALREADGRFGRAFSTGDLVSRIGDQWKTVRDTPAGQNALANARAHTDLLASAVFPLLETVVVNSKLAVDPASASRSLITALTESMPRMNEALSQARGYSAGVLLQRRDLPATPEQRQFLAAQLAIARVEGEAMARSLEVAMARNADFAAALRPITGRSTTARQSFESALTDYVIESPTVNNTSIFTLGARATEVSTTLLNESRGGLQKEFDSRANAAQRDLYATGGVALGGLLLASLLAIAVSRTITRPISHLAEVADRMSLGELDVDIDVTGANEVGQLAESLRRMQASLRSAIERLRQRRQAAA